MKWGEGGHFSWWVKNEVYLSSAVAGIPGHQQKSATVTQKCSGLQSKILDPCCGSTAATKLILSQCFLTCSKFSNMFMKTF